MNRVVRPLEQPVLAVLDELLRRCVRVVGTVARRRHHAGGDVVLGLHLARRVEIVAQTNAPGAVGSEADPQRVHRSLRPSSSVRCPDAR
jgi:hypothetical protein